MQLIFKDETFSYELIRAMGYAPYGGADIGECVATAAAIRDGDMESWYAEWSRTADRVAVIGQHGHSAGRLVSAREALLRASNYYRVAEFFVVALDVGDRRAKEAARRSRETFASAAALFDPPFERLSIPYEGTTLSGNGAKPQRVNFGLACGRVLQGGLER